MGVTSEAFEVGVIEAPDEAGRRIVPCVEVVFAVLCRFAIFVFFPTGEGFEGSEKRGQTVFGDVDEDAAGGDLPRGVGSRASAGADRYVAGVEPTGRAAVHRGGIEDSLLVC